MDDSCQNKFSNDHQLYFTAYSDYADMLFGWNVEQGITSNSVIYVKDGATVGIGTGEQDRVGVAEIAIFKAYTKHADALCFRKHGNKYGQSFTGHKESGLCNL